jgi:hypothetical protein
LNVEKQIAKLESLLGRIRRNASLPRPAAVALAPAPAALAEDTVPQSALPPTARVEAPLEIAAVARPPELGEVAPVEAVAEVSTSVEFEEMDMMDAELVEVGAGGAPVEADLGAEAASLEAEIVPVEDEAAPESAPRAAAQAFGGEADLETPVKTPPPESGRQVVMQVPSPSVSYQEEAEEAELGGAADVDSLLEADLSGGPISKAPPGMPTMEQLGDIVELEGADAPAALLELSVTAAPRVHEEPLDDLELALPKQEFGGGYDAKLAPPPEAARDLELHRQDMERRLVPAAHEAPFAVSAPPPMPAAVSAGPLHVARPPLDVPHPAQMIVVPSPKMPETFLELLDGSLGLHG